MNQPVKGSAKLPDNALLAEFTHAPAKDASVRKKSQSNTPLSCSVALVLAQNTSVTPLVAMTDDGDPVPFEGENRIRALQERDGKSALSHVIEAARTTGVADIHVLAPDDDDLFEQVEREANANGVVYVTQLNRQAETQRALKYKGLTLVGISAWVLEFGAQLVARNAEADSLLLLSADMPRITAGHLRTLCERRNELRATNNPVDAIASWIVWQRRLPLLVNETLLTHMADLLDQAESFQAPITPLRQFNLVDVVFGEEHLCSNGALSPGCADFLESVTLSALQAVAMAKHILSLPQDKREEAQANEFKSLNTSDACLLSAALEVATQEHPSRCKTKWADAWASRNALDFPLLNDRSKRGIMSYLDNAATTQRCNRCIAAMTNFDLHENANVYRGSYDLSMQATHTLNDARKIIEDFIGAQRRETIFTANTTASANLVAQAWGETNISAGDTIVVCLEDHHSNILPWMLLAERKGARLAYVPFDARGRLRQDVYDNLLEMGPKLVCLTAVGNVLGIENPVKSMAQRAHLAGATVFVDAAQGLPHKSLNVRDLGCDFLAFSAHKMYGPTGLGCLWIHPDAYDCMSPLGSGGGAVSHVGINSYYLRLGSIAYELGTPPVSQAVGFAAAIDYLKNLGMDNVTRHSSILTSYLIEGLRSIDGIWVLGDHTAPDGETGLVSLTVDGAGPGEIGSVLGKLGVCIRSGGHCALPLSATLGLVGSARISIGVYNTTNDIDAALVALKICRKLFS